MAKRLTITEAIEEFELYSLYNDTIESCGENLEDPSLVSDLHDLIDESEEEYEFFSDPDGDFSESFERNLIEAIHTIVEENEEMKFSEDIYFDDDFSETGEEAFEKAPHTHDEPSMNEDEASND